MILQRIQQFSQYTMKKLPYHRSQGLRTLTQIFFEQILIKTIGEVNGHTGHPDYVACF